ncbi:HDIG domain-containing protein [Caloramator quimbayensis]|uniref:HDIG domain-containing protein n=1 Tax=Caloramator quimbayensis TaxID=1147123 RepID=A0A1T4YD95_9CLOT|nr:HD-GYP domain-containing protein [Caloramator quimbayensis]SKA99508.1 HDIG domain-containing protein [Caloramator quimbayensis]
MKIKVNDIVPGSVLNDNIFINNGLLLVQKGTALSEKIIDKLKEYNIEYVDVDISSKDEDLKRISIVYTETVNKVKDKFKVVKLKNTVEISEFNNIVEELMDNINSNEILFYSKLLSGKDDYTLEHSINVSLTAMLMGKWLGYSKADIKLLGICGILHDIGKVLIPEYILNKPSKLTPSEYNIMKNHTKLGYQLLKKSNSIDERIKNVVLTHHERVNGKGYPFGLSGGDLSSFSKIISICDVYDAVTSKRVYKPKENVLNGLKAVFEDSYNGLDPYLCRVFLNNASVSYQGCKCLLNNGHIGRIIKIPSENPEKPWIAIDDEFLNLEVNKNFKILDVF